MPVKKASQATPNTLLRRARLEQGWSQQEVADLIDASHTFMISRWENGTAMPGPEYRQKLCTLFGKSLRELGLAKDQAGSDLMRTPASIYDPTIPLRLAPHRALVGRDQLLAELAQRLCDQEQQQLIALHGLPGAGKTAFVAELANTSLVQEYFADGILWAGLGPQANTLLSLSHWGTLCGMSAGESQTLRNEDEWGHALRAAIGTRRMLLIIDDVWEIEDALKCKIGGPHCSYLLTTRSPGIAVQFAGKYAVHIPELSLDDGVQLLTHIAPALAEMGSEESRSLVQAVGGLPLALMLMGNYLLLHTRHLQPRRTQAALTRLQQLEGRLQLELLQVGLDRDRRLPSGTPLTLQTIIRMSDARLSTALRQALSALSVFPAKPNAFSEEAALAVAATDVEVLDQLVDAGLIEINSQGRYQLHQVISDYEKAQGKNGQAEERAIAYMLSWAEQHQADYNLFEQDLRNIVAILQLAFEQNQYERAIRGTLVSAKFLRGRGLYSLAEQLLQRALSCSNAETDEQSHREILHNLVRSSQTLGNYEQAEQFAHENVALLRQRTDTSEALCDMLDRLGRICLHKGNYEQARSHVQEGLAIARRHAYTRLLCHLLQTAGLISQWQGDLVQTEIYVREGIALARQAHDTETLCHLLGMLGGVLADHQRHDEAGAYLQEGLCIAQQIGSRSEICHFFVDLGVLEWHRGNVGQAQFYWQEGLALARQMQLFPALAYPLTQFRRFGTQTGG